MPRLNLRLSLQLTLSRRRRPPPPWEAGAGDLDDAANDPPVFVTAADIAARTGVHEHLIVAIAQEHGMLGRRFTLDQAQRIIDILEPLPPGVA
ncbi:MAG: hypothetical protein H6742_14205 [Alphaproteobacteria bacterium]|nr:hypothetical protein [Alphaproteobacteria bacterium]